MEIEKTMKILNDHALGAGFWESENVAEKVMLMVKELSQAVEKHRTGDPLKWGGNQSVYNFQQEYLKLKQEGDTNAFKKAFELHLKETIACEMADAVMRIFDFCYQFKLDLPFMIANKIQYNYGRPLIHGKLY